MNKRQCLWATAAACLLAITPGAMAQNFPDRPIKVVVLGSSRMLLQEGTFDADSLLSPASVARMGVRDRDYTVKVISIPMVTAS